ncbi:OmpA family protein [Granulosicoccaceae sp. 1_MG-2023]|nr:OmpA family protein [Granulosicoccaceae sp. 1_MG-2023]
MSSVRTNGSWFVIFLALLGLTGLLWVSLAEVFDGRWHLAWDVLRNGKPAYAMAAPAEADSKSPSAKLQLSLGPDLVSADGVLPAGEAEQALLKALRERAAERQLIYRVAPRGDVAQAPWLAPLSRSVGDLPLDERDNLDIAVDDDGVLIAGTLSSEQALNSWNAAAARWAAGDIPLQSRLTAEPFGEWALQGQWRGDRLILGGQRAPDAAALTPAGLSVVDQRSAVRIDQAPLSPSQLTRALEAFAAAAPPGSGIGIDAEGQVDVQLADGTAEAAAQLQQELSALLPGKRVAVSADEVRSTASVPDVSAGNELLEINFAYNRADISPDSYATLDALAEKLSTNPALSLRIEGHTDTTGDPQSNLYLSRLRAEAVRDYLVSRGIAPDRLRAVGLGDTRPIADNSTAEGRHRNRRIEIRELSS